MATASNRALERLAAAIRERLSKTPAVESTAAQPSERTPDKRDAGPGSDNSRGSRRQALWLVGTVLGLMLVAAPGLAADGDLDTGFSDFGTFRLDTRPGFETVAHTVVLPDGGTRSLLGGPNIEVIALTAAGEPDLSFSDDGYSIVSPMTEVEPRSMAITEDGHIIVAGSRYDAVVDSRVPWIVRLDADGSLDLSFDAPDEATPAEAGAFNDVHIDTHGRIVAIGNLSEDVFVVRLAADGTADSSFAGNGTVRLPAASNGRAVRGTVDADDSIIVAGATPSDEADVFVVRVAIEGEVDSDFGTRVFAPLGESFHERASGVAIDTNGRIVVVGFAESFTVEAFVIRLLPSGDADPSLGGTGAVPVDALADTTAVGLAIDSAHRILVSGNAADDPGNQEAFLARLMPNGRPDSSFGADGYVVAPWSTAFDSYRSVVAMEDGRVMVGGLLSDAEPVIVVARYESEIPNVTFRDDDTSAFEIDIEAIANAGITLGCDSDGNFCPDDPVTRGQMAAFLVRALGYTDGAGDDLFGDDDTSIFEADIDRLATAGVTLGCDSDGNFCPDDPVTRGQMAAFLVRAFGYTDGAGDDLFGDDDTSIFEADIDRLARAGITQGCGTRLFCPSEPVTRGQMAAFLNRALELG